MLVTLAPAHATGYVITENLEAGQSGDAFALGRSNNNIYLRKLN
jgi:hypothetical protein